ncbi:MAG: phosphoribosylamine--glycine ligase [Phycisphaerales bacterium]|nr:phosphoribosylamine--glycine ligase [Phycisphaerales bacterium]
MDKVNVLLIGGGGREHALAIKLRQSPRLGTLWTTHPQNPGLAALAKPVDVPVDIREIYRLQQFCEASDIGLIVIGPEDPLAEGYADKLATPRTLVFGPTAQGAQLEADKAWCKQLLRSAAIPTAEARIVNDPESALSYIESRLRDEDSIRTILGAPQDFDRVEEKRRFIMQRLEAGIGQLGAKLPPELTAAVRARAAITCAVLASSTYRDPDDRRKAIREYIRTHPLVATAFTTRIDGLPVIKASGLAKGKGVILPSTLEEATRAIDDIMVRRVFGDAGATVILEERMSGPEVSVLAITDGRNILILPPCQDHKRLGDGDTGPNTGGMGAFCPTSTLDDAMMARIEREVLVPVVDALRREGIDYRGVLYAGLMLTPAGPKVLEFNARFGDPECQPLMARLNSDLLELMLATCRGRLDTVDVQWTPDHACCIVLASKGYPEKPQSGIPIQGLEKASAMPGVTVYHAGTRRDGDKIVTAGGRVLGVTALGATLTEARERAYAACDQVEFEGKTMRRDIGLQPERPARRSIARNPA